MVRVIAPLSTTGDESAADARIAGFLGRFSADLPLYVPD
jgi:hypothetical protein